MKNTGEINPAKIISIKLGLTCMSKYASSTILIFPNVLASKIEKPSFLFAKSMYKACEISTSRNKSIYFCSAIGRLLILSSISDF